MRKDQIFPSKYLKEADLKGREVVVTIESVERVTFQGKPGLVVNFEGKEKGLVVNQTIYDQIEASTGEYDTDNWPGNRITLYPTETTYQGEMKPVVRVRSRRPPDGGQHARTQAPPPPPAASVDPEDIPF
jgi:hypothetical protein